MLVIVQFNLQSEKEKSKEQVVYFCHFLVSFSEAAVCPALSAGEELSRPC